VSSLHHFRRWRLLGLLALVAAVGVAIPAASGAGPFAPAGSKVLCAHQCSAAALFSPSTLKKAEMKGLSKSAAVQTGTCAGGSIPSGTYGSLTITGFCAVDQGVVKVLHSVVVRPNAGLIAAFGDGPQLAVGGNLYVGRNAVLVLGCEPEAFACINDPDQSVGTLSSKGTIYGNLTASHPLAVIVHNADIGHNLRLHEGGGGYNCNPQDALFGSPAYATFEDTSVGGSASIDKMRTCWLGFFRTTVGGWVKYQNNSTADPDGNEVDTNVVHGNLVCSGNNPAAQVGDSGGFPNLVFGKATGECVGLTGP
jgi:hypothetical protein